MPSGLGEEITSRKASYRRDADNRWGLASRFRSSPRVAAPSRANFGIERALALYDPSAAWNLKFLRRVGRHSGRNFKFAALASRFRSSPAVAARQRRSS